VLEPRSYIDWKRGWIEQHAQPCCRRCCRSLTVIEGAGADLIAVVTACATATAISVGEGGAGAGATAGAAAAGVGGAAGTAKPVAESVISVPHCR